jgi:integrase
VYQEADGRWTGVVSFGYGPAGKRRRKKVHGQSKTEVLDKLRQVQGRGVEEVSKDTVEQFLTRWLENTAREKTGPTTYARYKQIVEHQLVPYIGPLVLSKLSAFHVEDFYAEMKRRGVANGSRRQAALVLTNALRHAVRLKLLASNRASEVPKPKLDPREMRVYTEEEVKTFLAAARRCRHFALFALAVATGMRRGELLALHWPDVDFDAGTVTIRRTLVMVGPEFILKEPKTKASRRTITVPAFALDVLHEHRKKMVARGFADRAVFCNCRGGFIRGNNLIVFSFWPILARADLPRIRFHDLRHTHATALLSHGLPIKAVSQRLGHSDVGITLRVYAHVLPTDDAKLAGAVQGMYA